MSTEDEITTTEFDALAVPHCQVTSTACAAVKSIVPDAAPPAEIIRKGLSPVADVAPLNQKASGSH
jgi:hypothetical protein